MGVEAAKDSRLVYDKGRICCRTETCKELIWLKDFMKELGKEHETLSLHSDSQSVVDRPNNPVYHNRTKHIDVQYHFTCIFLKNGVITSEDTHELKSHKHADQSAHDGETEDMLSLCGSSRVKIRS